MQCIDDDFRCYLLRCSGWKLALTARLFKKIVLPSVVRWPLLVNKVKKALTYKIRCRARALASYVLQGVL